MVLKNWIDDLNLRCVDRWKIGLFGSSFFMGNVIGSSVLSSYGDTIGRIPLMRISQSVTMTAYVYIVYFTRDITIICSLLFLIGLLTAWRLSLGYIYGQEIITETNQNMAGAMFNLIDAFTLIISSIFLMYIS